MGVLSRRTPTKSIRKTSRTLAGNSHSIRRIGTDPKLAEAVAAEALDQMARRRRDLDQEFDTQRRSLRQSNKALAREAADTNVDSGARFERIVGLQREIETTEQRLAELAAERR